MKEAPIKMCPHCGCSDEFMIKGTMTGRTQLRFTWDGELSDNSDMHDGLFEQYGKYAYCAQCEKRLFKVEDE